MLIVGFVVQSIVVSLAVADGLYGMDKTAHPVLAASVSLRSTLVAPLIYAMPILRSLLPVLDATLAIVVQSVSIVIVPPRVEASVMLIIIPPVSDDVVIAGAVLPVLPVGVAIVPLGVVWSTPYKLTAPAAPAVLPDQVTTTLPVTSSGASKSLSLGLTFCPSLDTCSNSLRFVELSPLKVALLTVWPPLCPTPITNMRLDCVATV